MNTKTIGNISEINVIKYFIERGYEVNLPFGENCRYDMVIGIEGKLFKIQVKTATLKKDYLSIPLASMKTNKTSNIWKGYKGDVDFIIGYCHELNRFFKIPINDIDNDRGIILRLNPAKNNQQKNIRWAKDYEL